MANEKVIAIYPGTFDPITLGHMDIAQRASSIFSHVIMAISENPLKETAFSLEVRKAMAQSALSDYSNIEIDTFGCLAVEYARLRNSKVIVRGLRALADYEYEIQMASANHQLDLTIDTILLSSAKDYTNVSSSLVKQIAYYGGNVANFVHPSILPYLDTLKKK